MQLKADSNLNIRLLESFLIVFLIKLSFYGFCYEIVGKEGSYPSFSRSRFPLFRYPRCPPHLGLSGKQKS